MFLRGLPHVCAKMRRPLKGQSAAAKELGQCPDFYKISKFAPLPPPTAPKAPPPEPQSPNQLQTKQKNDFTDHSPSKTNSTGIVSHDEVAREEGGDKKETSNTKEEAPKSPLPHQNEKTNVQLHSPSSLSSIEEGELRGMMAATGGMPPSPDTDHNKAAQEFPGSGSHGLDFASVGNSVTSWHDPQEQELTWGNTSATYAAEQAYHDAMGQVTPPRSSNIKNLHGGGGGMSNLQSPLGEESDTSGLSVADLCYLTQQNHILMDQSHKPGPKDGPK